MINFILAIGVIGSILTPLKFDWYNKNTISVVVISVPLLFILIVAASAFRNVFRPHKIVNNTPIYKRILYDCLFPSFFEELLFRRFLLDNFRIKMNTSLSVLMSSILFAISHDVAAQALVVPFYLLGGIFFGYARVFGGLLLPMVLHFTYNLIIGAT